MIITRTSMLKYYNTMVVFEEIPTEISLAINISNCPCRCPECHSKYLWEDIGEELTNTSLRKLIIENEGISAICLMGGDSDVPSLNELAKYVKENYSKIKVGWYSGRDELSKDINLDYFDYIKIGHYDGKYGSLDKETTNQRFYFVNNGELIDKTYIFRKG